MCPGKSVSVTPAGQTFRLGAAPPGGPRRHEPGLVSGISGLKNPTSELRGDLPPRIANQPYLLLEHHRAVLGGECHRRPARRGPYPAGDAIVPALVAGVPDDPPVCPENLVRDWGTIRWRLGIMIVLSITGIGIFNVLQYWALEYTQALNTLLLQSSGTSVVAMWSLILLGVRLTLAQAFGFARRSPACW